MKSILLTGASSFTGTWFVSALASRGWRVIAPLLRAREEYSGIRAARVDYLESVATVTYSCPFGSDRFFEVVNSCDGIDIFAHHAADVKNHGSLDFNDVQAFVSNTLGARDAIRALSVKGVRVVALTGTVFEAREGAPSGNALACNPYGLSKTLTSEAFRHWTEWEGLKFGKFVAGTPFGPFEEDRFCWYLFSTWMAGGTPIVRTPEYVRDNIPVPLMARAYATYLENLVVGNAGSVCRPSGYVASNEWFAKNVAREVSMRLGRDCPLDIAEQTDFSQPYSRVNVLPMISRRSWNESEFWDTYVSYYVRYLASIELSGRDFKAISERLP